MKRIKVGLNGFVRIGRAIMRIAQERNTFEIAAINTRKTTPDMLAYLLQYDSVYRRFNKKVEAGADFISVDGKKIPMNDFVKNILCGMIKGSIGTLHGVGDDWKTANIRLNR